MFEDFPYTNLHQLNLDWLVDVIEKLHDNMVISVNGQTGEVILYQNATMQLPNVDDRSWTIIRNTHGVKRGIKFEQDGTAYIVSGNSLAPVFTPENPPTSSQVISDQYIRLTTLTGEQLHNWNIFRTLNDVSTGIEFDDNGEAYIISGSNRYRLYSTKNPITGGVSSVNGQTGSVVLYTDRNGEMTLLPSVSNPSVDAWSIGRTVNGMDCRIYIYDDGQVIITAGSDEYRLVNSEELIEINDQISLLNNAVFTTEQLLNKFKINWKNNNAVTNNNDGTYTIGTTDYGLIVFGDVIKLFPEQEYLLYGVPNGIAYVYPASYTGSQSFNNAIITNDTNTPVKFTVQEITDVMVGFRSPSRPDTAYTIDPTLYRNYPITEKYFDLKTIVCDGDSIATGAYDQPKLLNGWFGRLQENYNIIGQNYAVTGATITNMQPTVSHSVCLNIDTIYQNYPTLDYLILEGGVNDADRIGNFDGDTPPTGFGTWSDENVSDYNGTYDNTTFCGAVEELFYKAVTYYPNAKIGFIIPMEMGTLMVPAKRRRRYFDEIIKIANKWHINVLDLWNVCHADARVTAYYGGTQGNLSKFYYDGQHPTSVGYDLLQPIIEAWMKTL